LKRKNEIYADEKQTYRGLIGTYGLKIAKRALTDGFNH